MSLLTFHINSQLSDVSSWMNLKQFKQSTKKEAHFPHSTFDCVDHNKLWKILKETGIPDHLTCLLRNLYAGRKRQLELDMEQQTGSKLEKEYVKAVYRHPAYLTYMQSTS